MDASVRWPPNGGPPFGIRPSDGPQARVGPISEGGRERIQFFGSQDLSEEFRFEDDEVYIKHPGDLVVLIPKRYSDVTLAGFLHEDVVMGGVEPA